jgi:hypothetical protein
MERVIRLIDILDKEVVDKLIMLDRLVMFYSQFLKIWRKAEVTSDGATVRVKFSNVVNEKFKFENFTERVFPIEKIDERICNYREKVKIEFKNRHENPRIQRAKEIRKWKNHIKDAKVSM